MTQDNPSGPSDAGSIHTKTSPAPEHGLPSEVAEDSRAVGPVAPKPEPMEIDTIEQLTVEEARPSQAESQPMTASNSTSSHPSSAEVGSGPTPTYGTRSRRTATARPNYAEDKEMDIEFETAPVKEAASRKGAKGVTGTDERISNGTPNGVPAEDYIVSMPSHYKEPIPGTSTFSTKPPSSKKRKAPNQANTTEPPRANVTHAQNLLTPQAITRRQSHAAEAITGIRDSNMLSFDDCNSRLKNKKLVADDGTTLEVNDHVYMICEPPGEPYYTGRIMDFVHVNGDPSQAVEALQMNWYYRPKDIGRKVNDTRQLFASMHSDISPLSAVRGKCQIKHKSELSKSEDVRQTNDCFWYEKLYDRYIHRYYDVVPTSAVINVPANVKQVLDERWRYIIVEPSRAKELTSAVKSCKRCSKYCASNDSVDCAVCKNTYHMSCVSPPLQKKPSRGFAWACGPCSKAQERKLEARNAPNVNDLMLDTEEDEPIDEEESAESFEGNGDTNRASPERPDEAATSLNSVARVQPSSWLYRYLGIHCKVEDALDFDDRIHPRAGSRLGPRHQAIVPAWPGREIVYVKPTEVKKKFMKGKKNAVLSKETVAALEADKIEREKRPKWVMDEPAGYVERGQDLADDDPNNTARLLFKMPDAEQIPSPGKSKDFTIFSDREKYVHEYMNRARDTSERLGLPIYSTNLLDVALSTLRTCQYNCTLALEQVIGSDKRIVKEPELNPAEVKKFEDGVAKFGSEWHSIKKHVKTVSAANIVRFYYTWKKTDRGKQIWGKFHGRKNKKEAKKSEYGKLADDVADANDDSAFDNMKAFEKKRRFQCKFCSTQSSRQWRRAPNTPSGTMIAENPSGKTGKEKGDKLMVALCRRCAELWRRYAIQWEHPDDYLKKIAQTGGRVWKRKIDDEILKELAAANEMLYALNGPPMGYGPTSGSGTPSQLPVASQGNEPPRKKLKNGADIESLDQVSDVGVAVNPPAPKKKIEKPPPPPPPPPEPPKARTLPCGICNQLQPKDQLLACRECRMSVHRRCYGVVGDNRLPGKWICDLCSNDKNPQVSVQYKCMLCPNEEREYDFVEPLKITHKKKTEKDKERERVEREKAQKDADFFLKRQEDLNKPLRPREPLKRTANNNWVHVTCAVFTPEVKFGNAKALEPSEGIPSILPSRYDEICKACKKKEGACVTCRTCHAPVHVECARRSGYTLGFDVTPVKGSRRDHPNVVSINGETGIMTAAVWCKEHVPSKTIVHDLHSVVEGQDLIAMQLFVQTFKQADLTLTGTVRKATLLSQSAKILSPTTTTTPPNRRASTINTGRGSALHVKAEESSRDLDIIKNGEAERTCVTCSIDVSPRWWPTLAPLPVVDLVQHPTATNGELEVVQSVEVPLGNGSTNEDTVVDSNSNHVALAVAALHQNVTRPVEPLTPPLPTEFQCNKCHHKKVVKEPTPLPPTPTPPKETASPRVAEVTEPDVRMLDADAEIIPQVPQYAWPQQQNHPPQPVYSNGWPVRSPPMQGNSISNGSQSPHHLNGVLDPQLAGPVQSSPHLNGHISRGLNGHPHSPHRNSRSPVVNMHGSPNHGSVNPGSIQPHHVTNGGPPARAPESPIPHIAHRDTNYSPWYDSQSVFSENGYRESMREMYRVQQERDMLRGQEDRESEDRQRQEVTAGRGHQPPSYGGPPMQDRRVNGGASASPSLQNLLH